MQIPQLPKKKWSREARTQLLKLTKGEIIGLLDNDENWERADNSQGTIPFRNPNMPSPHNYLTIHYHPKETFRHWSLLEKFLQQICWTEDSLLDSKVIKIKGRKRKKPR
ncbi:MAG: hypothetical protein CL946_00675 [Ectothiorhodospiraceae bacterium]|nr:hypothetical protein [Ectothiorhodospiraceae bacterium]